MPYQIDGQSKSRAGVRKWAEDELRWLKMHYEAHSDVAIARKFERSPYAVLQKRRELGLVRLNLAGFTTLGRLVDETGYGARQIRRARDMLGQTWKRVKEGHESTGQRSRYNITYEQADEIVQFLGKEWGPAQLRLTCCIRCTRADRPHKARGMCKPCFYAEQRKARKGRPSLLEMAPVTTFMADRVVYAPVSSDKAA